jgi:hypothetical protein
MKEIPTDDPCSAGTAGSMAQDHSGLSVRSEKAEGEISPGLLQDHRHDFSEDAAKPLRQAVSAGEEITNALAGRT